MTRAFIAINPPDDVKLEIGSLINELKNKFPAINWENPQKIHLTLAFLGHIQDEKVEIVKKHLAEVVKNYYEFPLEISQLSYFYKKHEDSIIFLEVKDETKLLQNLFKELRLSLEKKNIALPSRLKTHITIGKLRRQRYPHEVKKKLQTILTEEVKPIGKFTVRKIDLYESLYSKNLNTSEFRLLQSFPLESK